MLIPGRVITAPGTRLSLASDDSDIVIGTSTEGLGGYLSGGLGVNGTGVQPFTGMQKAHTGGCGLAAAWV